MVLDIANTGVARGKIYLARQEGIPIPDGWAINAAGAPALDPAEAIDGIILPMAQHKGYAKSLCEHAACNRNCRSDFLLA